MSVDEIAKVIADLKARRVKPGSFAELDATGREREVYDEDRKVLLNPLDGDCPVVDVTSLYRDLLARKNKSLDPYDVVIAPPWNRVALAYVNEAGNVIVHLLIAGDWKKERQWTTTNGVEWDRVRWEIGITVWAGGWAGRTLNQESLNKISTWAGRRIPLGGMPMQTAGPLHAWMIAVYEDGSPADIKWMQTTEWLDDSEWGLPLAVVLSTLNFMNCRNVQIVEPHRPRPERRRLAKSGIRIHTLSVFPVSRQSAGSPNTQQGTGTPLTTVKGSFHHYGPASEHRHSDGRDRGLLFGKVAGRFWVPQHARGDSAHGEVYHDYKVRTS